MQYIYLLDVISYMRGKARKYVGMYVYTMAIWAVEFSSRGYKIGKNFA